MKAVWLFIGFFALLLPAYSATVTSCEEAALRGAIAAGGTVDFACDGTIVLSNTLTISNNITIDGSGHSVILSGNQAVRVLFVNSGVQFGMTNVTVANGATNAPGAGLYSNGSTRLVNCTFSNNVAHGEGGAVYQGRATLLTIQGCSFLNNIAASTNSFGSF